MDTDDVLDAIGGKYEYEDEDEYDEYAEIAPYLCIVIWTKDADDESTPDWTVMTTDEVEDLNKIQGFNQEFEIIEFTNIIGFQDEVIEYYKLQKKFNSLKLSRRMRIAFNKSYDSEEIDYKIDEVRHQILTLHETLNQKIC
jgi:hypothetical protein